MDSRSLPEGESLNATRNGEQEGAKMLQAKLISAKNLDELEANICTFLEGEQASQVESVSGVATVRHPTIGSDTFVVVVTYQK